MSYPSKKSNTLAECKEFCNKEANKANRLTYNSNHMDVVGAQSDCACCSPSSGLVASDDGEVYTREGDHIYGNFLQFYLPKFLYSIYIYVVYKTSELLSFQGIILAHKTVIALMEEVAIIIYAVALNLEICL